MGVSGPVVLSLNPGSSSFKAAVRGGSTRVTIHLAGATMTVDAAGEHANVPAATGIATVVEAIAGELDRRGLAPAAVAHRVVHGGPRHHLPSLVDDRLVADLAEVVPLAPLHLPDDLASIAAARTRWPRVPHVACFDTGFHHGLPLTDRRLPLPDELVAAGMRRYGFHGLSMQSVLHAEPELGQAVVAHLGSGCSVTAIADGVPRHTTMSLTPTGGMMSVTRSGDLDPEVLLSLVERHGYSAARLRGLLERSAGLAGVAGGRSDVAALLAATDDDALLAVEMFVRAAAMAIAASAVTLDRWDALVFTGGIGERAAGLRDRICARLLPLRGGPAATVGAVDRLAATGVRVLVVPADEDGVLDRSARDLLGLTPPDADAGTG